MDIAASEHGEVDPRPRPTKSVSFNVLHNSPIPEPKQHGPLPGKGTLKRCRSDGTAESNTRILEAGRGMGLRLEGGGTGTTTIITAAGDHWDVSTGAVATRIATVQVVSDDYRNQQPKPLLQRMKSTKDLFGIRDPTPTTNDGQDQNTRHDDGGTHVASERNLVENTKIYRINSKTRAFSGIEWLRNDLLDDDFSLSWISRGIRWTFEASFFAVGVFTFIAFLAVSIVFALFIYWDDSRQSECILIYDGTERLSFVSAFHFSWTVRKCRYFFGGLITVSPHPFAVPFTHDLDSQYGGIWSYISGIRFQLSLHQRSNGFGIFCWSRVWWCVGSNYLCQDCASPDHCPRPIQ